MGRAGVENGGTNPLPMRPGVARTAARRRRETRSMRTEAQIAIATLSGMAPEPILVNQPTAAKLLGVSTAYLRRSDAPRVMLPSRNPRGRPVLRYDRALLVEWARAHLASKVNA